MSEHPDLPTVTFADGIQATTTGIRLSRTYSDYLEFRPLPLQNKEYLARLRDQVKSEYRPTPVLMVPVDPATIDPTATDSRPLPRFEFTARFTSQVTMEAGQDFSWLTLVWHQDTPYPFIDQQTARKIAGLKWFRYAGHGSW
jgi:hypothetical protein